MAKRKLPPPPPSLAARENVLLVMRAIPEPVMAKPLAKMLTPPHRISEADLVPILEEYVAAGRLFRFPPKTAKGKQPRYWDRDLAEFTRQVIVTHLQVKGPQSAANLKKRVKELTDAQFQPIFQGLIDVQEIWRHPPVGKTKRELYGSQRPAPEPYLKEVGGQLAKIVAELLAANVSRDDLRRALLQIIEAAGVPFSSPRGDAAPVRQLTSVDVVALMRRIEPGAERGALVGARDLRRAAALEKTLFDRTVLELARQGQLSLHRHDYPASLSAEERDELVTDGNGTYYVGVALRQSKD